MRENIGDVVFGYFFGYFKREGYFRREQKLRSNRHFERFGCAVRAARAKNLDSSPPKIAYLGGSE